MQEKVQAAWTSEMFLKYVEQCAYDAPQIAILVHQEGGVGSLQICHLAPPLVLVVVVAAAAAFLGFLLRKLLGNAGNLRRNRRSKAALWLSSSANVWVDGR